VIHSTREGRNTRVYPYDTALKNWLAYAMMVPDLLVVISIDYLYWLSLLYNGDNSTFGWSDVCGRCWRDVVPFIIDVLKCNMLYAPIFGSTATPDGHFNNVACLCLLEYSCCYGDTAYA
jgi:hypothetical protein